jgi:hypothetical protein
MDSPFYGDPELARRARGPAALWILLAVIGVVLTGLSVLAAFSTDTRDFAARHGTVLESRAL